MRRVRWSRLLMPEELVTAPVFLVSLALIALGHFLDFENFGDVGRPLERALLLVAVQLVAFAVPAAAYYLLRHRIRPDPLVAVLLACVVIGATLRSHSLYLGLGFISGRPFDVSTLRAVASIANVALVIVAIWAAFSAAESHRRRRRRLLEEQDQVLRLREQAQAQLDVMDAEAAEEIRATLMESVAMRPGVGADQFSASLRQLIDEVVRPLSRYFEQQSHDWMPPPTVGRAFRVDWRAAWWDALTPSRIHPVVIVGILVWIALPNILANRGAAIAVASVVQLIAIGTPLLLLVKWLGERYAAGRPPGQQATTFLVGLYVGGQILGLTSIVYTRFQEPRFGYVIATPVYVVIAGTLIALAESAMAQSRAMDDALSKSTEELRWSLARAREMHRVQRRALAHALHGKVQAALAASVLRLETSSVSDPERDALARQMAHSLEATISDVDFLFSEAERLEVVLERISATWEGAASVSARVDDGLSDRLAADPICAVAVNDLLTELVFNSIKHGSASLIEIRLQSPTSKTLEVVVIDNGHMLPSVQRRGLGSALLDDCAISWRRSRIDDRTCCVAILPID